MNESLLFPILLIMVGIYVALCVLATCVMCCRKNQPLNREDYQQHEEDVLNTEVKRNLEMYIEDVFTKYLGRNIDSISKQLLLHDIQNKNKLQTDPLYSAVEETIKVYQQQVESGKERLKKQRWIITGLIRNHELHLPLIQSWFSSIQSFFEDVRMVIVENDSSDGTRHGLLEMAKKDERIIILCDNIFVQNQTECLLNGTLSIDTSSIHRTPASLRIYKMSYLRNIYVRFIQENYKDWDHVMVIDFDLQGFFFEDGFCHAVHLMYDQQIDIVSGNGLLWNQSMGEYHYYDSFAFIEKGFPTFWTLMIEKQLHDDYVHDHVTKRLITKRQPLQVETAFGGFSIYKMNWFQNHSYSFSPDKLQCEHSFFHKDAKIVIDPHFIFLIDSNG